MSNQLFVAKNNRAKKKKNATNAMVAAFFCVSSSLTAPAGVRAFSAAATGSVVPAFVRSSRRGISSSSAARSSLAFASTDSKKYRHTVLDGAAGITRNTFWKTTTTTSLRATSTTTAATEGDTSTVAPSSSVRPYDVDNIEAGLGNYVPTEFESQIYQWWESSGCFQPDAKQTKEESDANGRKPYVLPMPPPNVTGRLHMGHAMFVAIQDGLARFHRMRGRPVLWLPGA